ncbi:deaminase [Actinopolyspora mortivallis]|uniref:deaminase n=1 Tax=Actinopolyspora mortivallis TaxID=33906 RepID=UPI00037A7E30|nr:nucleoside deaminase [Actinopolyspora mortivallis]
MASALFDKEHIDEYVNQAVELSLRNVAEGGVPFSALVVDPERGVVGTGVNRVLADRDPLAHAEVVALRAATGDPLGLRTTGRLLIASGEPCALCYVNALYSNVTDVISAVDRYEVARLGFNYLDSYRLFAAPPEKWAGMTVRTWPVESSHDPFTAWRERQLERNTR